LMEFAAPIQRFEEGGEVSFGKGGREGGRDGGREGGGKGREEGGEDA
jgi:hypothetical protein